MNQFGNFSLGLLIGIVGLYSAMHYTVVQAKDGFHVIPKISPKLDVPYQDIRGFRLSHWQKQQSLALAIVRADKGYLLNDPTLLTFRESVQSVLSKYQTRNQKTESLSVNNAIASH